MAICERKRANESVTGAVKVLIALASMTPAPANGQGWSQPRTPDGQPDLQGVWSNATLTPLERPAAFAGREFLTEKEQIGRASCRDGGMAGVVAGGVMRKDVGGRKT